MSDNPTCREEAEALAKREGLPLRALSALAVRNDPFLCGTPDQLEWASWFQLRFAEHYRGGVLHVRRLHYLMVSSDPRPKLRDAVTDYENTERHYQLLSDASRFARHIGFVDPTSFVDRRNPSPHVFAFYGLTPDHEGEPGWDIEEAPAWLLPFLMLGDVGDFDLPAANAHGYDYSLRDQPHHLELWIEKSTMNDVLLPICQRYGVNLVTGVGFQSITGVVQLLKRLEALPDDRPTRIGYISDWDPAGETMPVAVARQVEFYVGRYAKGRDIKLKHLVLTGDQIAQYGLPRIPIKDTDPRKAHFEDRRGEGAVELDALEALRPGELGRIVREFILAYRDPDLAERLSEAGSEAQEEVEARWDEATSELRERLEGLRDQARKILNTFRPEVEALNARIKEALAPVRAQLDEARHAVADLRENVTADLPGRPEADLKEPQESDWLYASDRDYLQQMRAYQAAKGVGTRLGRKTTSIEEYEQTCSHCGTKYRPKKRGYRAVSFCGPKCASAARYIARKQANGEGKPKK